MVCVAVVDRDILNDYPYDVEIYLRSLLEVPYTILELYTECRAVILTIIQAPTLQAAERSSSKAVTIMLSRMALYLYPSY